MTSRALAHLHRAALRPLPRCTPTLQIQKAQLSPLYPRHHSSSTQDPPAAAPSDTITPAADAFSEPSIITDSDDSHHMDEVFQKIRTQYKEQPREGPRMRPAEPQAVVSPRYTKALLDEARIALDATEEEKAAAAEALATEGPIPIKAKKSKYKGEERAPALPELETPPRPEGYPTPWFTSQQFIDHILPLYQYGWHLGFQKMLQSDAVTNVLGDRNFTFEDWNQGMAFINGVDVICREEDHHPIEMSIILKNRIVTVTLALRTHSAIRPEWIKRDERPLRISGVTMRDIRVAILIEDLYKSKFGGGAPSVLPPRHRQPLIPAIHKLLNLAPRKLHEYCTACGGHHGSEQCDHVKNLKKQLLPHCSKCGQRHAMMSLCPKTRKRGKVLMPATPCPNCGKMHWLEDCRKPQLPPGEAEALMIPLSFEGHIHQFSIDSEVETEAKAFGFNQLDNHGAKRAAAPDHLVQFWEL
ncbi:hypothetical protein C0991_002199 [Blastosporella zonata]|nr:hypothetical protein C0991_002199 [Blastosporella zonata]